MSARYRQVFLQADNGLFMVSVAADVPIDGGRRIINPQSVFAEYDTLVAVAAGEGEFNATGQTQYGGMAQEELPPGELRAPRVEPIRTPRFGVFDIRFTENGGVELRETVEQGALT
jgi:hypothetical protein